MNTVFGIIFLIMLNACGAGRYVLHSAKDPYWGSAEEDSAIPDIGGVALHYDRRPFAYVHKVEKDHSVDVEYELVVKNSSEQDVMINLSKIKLSDKKALSVMATYELKESKVQIKSNERIEVPIKFQLDKKFISHYGNGRMPIFLEVPIDGKGNLALELYLWDL